MKILSISGRLIYDSNSEITIKDCLLEAIKYGADLSGADLSGANLYGANLSRSDLSEANLSEANLSRADLSRANLFGADLSGANLYGANLSGANLYGANLSGANLSRSDLSEANLSRADLSEANLSRADLSEANNKELAYTPMYCKWSLSIIGNKIKVGCKEKTATEWIKWLKSDEEYDTKRGTEEFKQIEACIRAYIAYQKVLNN